MANNNGNSQTNTALAEETKELKNRCNEVRNIISNTADIELTRYTVDNLQEKSSCYLEGLRTDLESTEVPIVANENLITSQYLTDTEQKIKQLEELIAYKRGLILDIDAETSRLKGLIKMGEEAKCSQKTAKLEVKPEHLQKAKQRFRMMKNEFHGLVYSLYPKVADDMMELLAQLMQNRLDVESPDYVEITSEQFLLIEMLKDMGIVVTNPYNKQEIKLAEI